MPSRLGPTIRARRGRRIACAAVKRSDVKLGGDNRIARDGQC
jgi:hypothetical protein